MRWDAQIDLVDRVWEPNEDGSYLNSPKVVKTVFCNRQTVGKKMVEGRHSAFMKADAAVKIHFQDYEDQEEAILDGVSYTIEEASRRGDYIVLTLGRMGRNE